MQYYNGDLLGFIPQPKPQERDRTSLTHSTRLGRAIALEGMGCRVQVIAWFGV
ncbi:hypothetical protein [Nostoc sp. C057]|uniref:hypothetical protein n=1 Tax=Nostoc sp. C057 TaxID=2576903 RepID=UPI0015C34878|nr:hypothetical protein [Nostoc sp. C057]